MDLLNNVVNGVNNILWTYVLIIMLIGIGLYFTIKTGFVQFRYFGEMFRLLGENFNNKSNKNQVSSFQAFCISTASRVGTGNLAGVALAIASGGPGAVFWMWAIALIGGGSSFIESTLAQIYKVKDGDGYRGGPAYYIEKGLGLPWLGTLFSILITFSFGFVFNATQVNTITFAFNEAFNVNRLFMGLIIAALTIIVIFGGVKRIASISEKIVPVMATIYVLVVLIVMGMNITQVPKIFAMIFAEAFGIRQVMGGALGVAMMEGIKRGLFSNEAGMGSAPNAAATAEVTHPVKQGLIQTLGVFTDTILICSCTAFIILVYLSEGNVAGGATGIQLTQNALASQVGSWASIFVAISIFLFGYSSVIGNYYYGETNIEFLGGNKAWMFVYRCTVIGFVIFGSIAQIGIVWALADVFMGIMAIVNLIAILKLSPIAIAALKDYTKQKKEGKEPVFKAKSIPNLKNTDCWND